jgi:isopentenyl-diphosphate delta-isomerase
MALGARAAGIARPVLQLLNREGEDGVRHYLDEVVQELRSVMLLTGTATVEGLREAPRIIEGDLEKWLSMPRGGA